MSGAGRSGQRKPNARRHRWCCFELFDPLCVCVFDTFNMRLFRSIHHVCVLVWRLAVNRQNLFNKTAELNCSATFASATSVDLVTEGVLST